MSVINTIIHDDVLKGLSQIPDETISLVFTSPPYNTEIDYGSHEDDMPWREYLAWLQDIWKECARVLRPGGRLAINIDAITNWDDDKDQEYVRPIYAELVNQMREIDGLNFRTEIMWCKTGDEHKPETGQVVGRATAWGSYMSCSNPIVMRNHEYILVWSKGSWTLHGDSEYSDMSSDEFTKFTRSTWCVSPESRKPGRHPAPFPEELCRRVIKLFSYRGDVVLDPFCGSGTTCRAAVNNWRRFIGIDCDENYVKYARSKIREAIAEQPYYQEAGGDPSVIDDYAEKVGFTPRSEKIKNKQPSRTQRKKNKSNREPDIADVM